MTVYTVITLGGIGERPDESRMSANLTRELDFPRFTVREFEGWDRRFIDSRSYVKIRRAVAKQLAKAITDTVGPVVLVGFSAGAHIIGDAILMLTGEQREKIAYTVLCADPAMPRVEHLYRNQTVVGTLRYDAFGITGSRPVWTSAPIVWVSAGPDAICQCPSRSPLRTVADRLSVLEPNAGATGAALYEQIAANTGKAIDTSPVSLWGAAVDLDGYLRRGEHVRPYPALLAQVGRTMNATLR